MQTEKQKNISRHVPSLPEMLALHGRWRGQDEAVICDEQRLTWSEFTDLSHQFAHGLLAANVSSGDRVGIVMSNGIPMLQALLGTMACSATSVPINLSVNDDALINMLSDAEVVVIVATQDQQQRIDKLRPKLPSSVKLFISETGTDGQWLSIDDLCDQQSSSLPAIIVDDDSLLNIIYSSGTTGNPKGIAHTFGARRDWAYDLSIALRYHPRVRTLLTIGLYSNISWIGMLCTLLAGGTIILHKKFDALSFLNTVAQEKITHTAMVPVQFQRITDEFDNGSYSVESMQAMMCCGSPLQINLKQKLFHYFPCGVIELYGLTEGIVTTLDPEIADGRWASVGRPLLGTDVRVLDEQDKVLPANQSGEIVSRGRVLMDSYFKNKEATEDCQYIDELGQVWLRSGDLGYLDEEGYLFVVDRKKDMILSGGQNIYPQDIEAVLSSHADIYDVAVIGVKSQRWGETPLALVVPTKNTETAVALLSWANASLGKQQRLRDLIFVDQLPRNPNGKLLKRELRKKFEELCYE